YSTELEHAETSPDGHSLALSCAATLRAQMAWLSGDATAALATLDRGRLEPWLEYPLASPFFSQAYERYLRAQLLQSIGRNAEALGWYASFGESALYDRIYLAPSHLHRAEIYDRIGDREKARFHYQRFVELWKDADPQLQPMIADVEQRLSRME